MTHGNIAAVYSHNVTSDNLPFICMDYLEGETLEALLRREGRLDFHRALGLFQQICEALIHAHMKGVLHRDLKPANIFISKNIDGVEVVKLVDFGIAKLQYLDQDSTKLTRTGAIIGSPYYMSPEQCRGAKEDERSDIYSLGCVMFHALSGMPPFQDENAVKVVLQHIRQPPPVLKFLRTDENQSEIERQQFQSPEGQPELQFESQSQCKALEACIRRCLEKDPEARYDSVGSLLADLHSLDCKQANRAVSTEAKPALVRRFFASVIDGLILTFIAHVIGRIFLGYWIPADQLAHAPA